MCARAHQVLLGGEAFFARVAHLPRDDQLVDPAAGWPAAPLFKYR